MKKLLVSLLIISASSVLAQESSLVTEKYRVGLGIESNYYVDWPVSTYGTKVEIVIPIYKRLATNISFSDYENYFDVCYDIPVDVKERHFAYGAIYQFAEFKKFTFNGVLNYHLSLISYTELDELPNGAIVIHNEEVHEEEHNDYEHYSDLDAGFDVNYQLSNRILLNYSSRINTWGSLRNSFSVNYMFDLKSKK